LAWISVHDHVIGGKLRGLSKSIGCSQKEALGILVSLWLWGLNNADQSGQLKFCDKTDIAEEIAKGLSVGLNPQNIVISLIEEEWIEEDIDGTLYLHDWDTWQEQWYKFLGRKEFDAERKRNERARKKIASAQVEVSEEPTQVEPLETKVTDNLKDIQPPKEKKTTKKKPEKKAYAEYVSLQEIEYEKLVEKYGERATQKMIEVLNLYKGSTGKAYKSDYMTILNWVVNKVQTENPNIIKAQESENYITSEEDDNPFERWKECKM